MLQKLRIQLAGQLDEAKRNCDDEARERQALLGKYRNVEHELDGMKSLLDEETGAKDDVARQLTKSAAEAEMWHQKYEKDGLARAEELEMSKMKLQARLTEAQSTIEGSNAKLNQLDKAKQKLQVEIEDMAAQTDQVITENSVKSRATFISYFIFKGTYSQQCNGKEGQAVRPHCCRMEAEG